MRSFDAANAAEPGVTSPTASPASRLDLRDVDRMRAHLARRLEVLEQTDQHHRGGQLDFTERRMDEQKPSGTRSYILAHQLIGTAVENYNAVFSLIEGAGGGHAGRTPQSRQAGLRVRVSGSLDTRRA
ncbi:hypothetical protein [Microlunatus flavus]|uniref:hypothetical protein n=1 Tax=Microlunatus flavus TaxID=1036181 RepID=UPI0011140CAA|nr:hypothetical protein [Microlunatus flavus]